MPPRASDPRGFVSLIGAGPAGPDLLTLRGHRALQQAEVVLYDALLDPSFSAVFPSGAILLPVGKRGGRPGTLQEDIYGAMLYHARQGRRVARLKGGDPLIFGRGGEEAQALEAAGIPFEVIPGVSALQAGAAAAGFPLTHRQVSRRITVIEGQHLPGDAGAWRNLVDGGGTLAVYMGTGAIGILCRRFLEHGADPDLPVALVERAQCPGQRIQTSTLCRAAQGALEPSTGGPGILYLGPALLQRFHPESPHAPAAPLPGPPRKARTPGGRRASCPGQGAGAGADGLPSEGGFDRVYPFLPAGA